MKKTLFMFSILCTLFMASCGKKGSTENNDAATQGTEDVIPEETNEADTVSADTL